MSEGDFAYDKECYMLVPEGGQFIQIFTFIFFNFFSRYR
jgi:hypothetical protein